ncbi:MAG: helix-turn-helix domain-containing protein [Patescibacteria group bacterium]|nr:helix-turn-helix domain-containing protein [Patescibacteria group bacterium]
MSTLDLDQAADFCKCSPHTLRKLAHNGVVPGAKVGRRWVFLVSELENWIAKQCHSTSAPVRHTGGSGFPSLAERLAAQRAQRIAAKRRNSNSASANDSGACISSATVVPFDSLKSQHGG